MTIEDLIESGIEIQGDWTVLVFGAGEELNEEWHEREFTTNDYRGRKWYDTYQITYIYYADDGCTIEVREDLV